MLVPYVAVPAGAAWFWSDGHQAVEREVDTDPAAGRSTDFDGEDAFLAHVGELDRRAGG